MTRDEFISFLKDFKADFEQDKSYWENKTLGDFLDSMISYTEDIQGYYDNMKMDINADNPTWENFMNIIKGASMYE